MGLGRRLRQPLVAEAADRADKTHVLIQRLHDTYIYVYLLLLPALRMHGPAIRCSAVLHRIALRCEFLHGWNCVLFPCALFPYVQDLGPQT